MATGAIVARILTQYTDKGSKAARKDIAKLGKNFDQFAAKAGKAFLLAGAASAAFAVKIGTDAVQAAIEDQKSQAILANSLRNTVGATDEAIASTERFIAKQQLLVGVSDTQLRQSLITLTGATRSLSEAQSLQNIALDVAASGYGDVESVSKALAKAYGGNLGALKKLVPGIDANIIKSKDFNKAMEYLTSTMGGAAATAADTLEGRLRILKRSYDEIIESLGFALLPIVQEFAGYLLSDVLPRVQEWVDLNKDKLAAGLKTAAGYLKTLLENAMAFGQWVTDNTGKVKAIGILIGTMFAVNAAAKFVLAIQGITAALVALRNAAIGTAIATAFATGGLSLATAATGLAAIGVTALATKNFLSSMTGSAEKATKATEKLKGSHVSSLKLNKDFVTTNNKYNTSLTNTINTTKTLTAEQKKALEVQAQLAKFGVTTKEDDPIQLEAARLNLIKQQAIGIEAIGNASWAFLEAQLANNTQAQRYADILAVINDNKISSAEVDALAYKWGKSADWVLNYIRQVTGINTIVIDKDFGADAATGWDKARIALEKYLATLGAGAGATPLAPAAPSVTAPAIVGSDAWAESQDWWRSGGFGAPTASAGTSIGSSATSNSNITVNVNAGNVIADRNELVEIVRGGILAGQISGSKITLNALDL